MANVTKGAKVASSGAATGAPTSKGGPVAKADAEAAARLREALDNDQPADHGAVAYVGNTDHLWAENAKPILDKDRNVVGRDNGLFIDFRGFGVTDKYFPERSAKDKAYVERLDAWIKTGGNFDEVSQFNIRKLEPGQPEPPLAGWELISASALAEVVAAKLGDDHDANVEYVKECARYEREVGGDRVDVLAMLDSLLVQEAAGSDVFEATVVLN